MGSGPSHLRRGSGMLQRDRSPVPPVLFRCDRKMDGGDGGGSWAGLPPELLWEVVRRVEQGEPARTAWQHLLACASVCRLWREACREIIGELEAGDMIALPTLLKQPGPHVGMVQCYLKRNKATSTYHFFVGFPENGKFLLAARRICYLTCVEYIISTAADDISCDSVSYMGKLRSNLLRNKFSLHDSQHREAMASSGRHSTQLLGSSYSRKASPKVLPSELSYDVVAHIVYGNNPSKAPRPRRIRCTVPSPAVSALEPASTGNVPCIIIDRSTGCCSQQHQLCSLSMPPCSLEYCADQLNAKALDSASSTATITAESSRRRRSTSLADVSAGLLPKEEPLVFRNKTPRWNEKQGFWCLNFRGRVSVASVKNFQLIKEDDKLILQFGKIGDDMFNVDYQYPLSAFQAFGICLTTFGRKLYYE